MLRPVQDALFFVVRPVQLVFYRTGSFVSRIPFFPSHAVRLAQENERLREEINRLLAENARLLLERQQTGILQEQLEFLTKNSFQGVPVRVIAKSSDALAQIVIVNRGTNDGIFSGAPVIVGDGVLVGKVIATTALSAHIRLLIDNQSQFSAVIQNDSQSEGLLTGSHGLALQLQFIPQLDSVVTGQSVITSGKESFIPKGLIIGSIDTLSKPAGELFQQATVRTPIDFRSLDVLTVILSAHE